MAFYPYANWNKAIGLSVTQMSPGKTTYLNIWT